MQSLRTTAPGRRSSTFHRPCLFATEHRDAGGRISQVPRRRRHDALRPRPRGTRASRPEPPTRRTTRVSHDRVHRIRRAVWPPQRGADTDTVGAAAPLRAATCRHAGIRDGDRALRHQNRTMSREIPVPSFSLGCNQPRRGETRHPTPSVPNLPNHACGTLTRADAHQHKPQRTSGKEALPIRMQGARVRGITIGSPRLDQQPLTDNAPPPPQPVATPLPFDLATPRRGHVLTTTSEALGRPIRTAAEILTQGLPAEDCTRILDACGLRQTHDPGAWIVRTGPEMLAWSMVSIWLTAFATRAIPEGQGIDHATSWFFAEAAPSFFQTIPKGLIKEADHSLSACDDPSSYRQLLPYVLDPHGPGSRLSILRNAATRTARDSKRSTGVYYTPSDVAAYMVREVIRPFRRESHPPGIFDPACGTAVFLRAALVALRAAWPHVPTHALSARLYGTDIDPLALQAAAFVLLADCLTDAVCPTSPVALWRGLRTNLACVDALRLDTSQDTRPDSPEVGHTPQQRTTRLSLTQLFPHIEDNPLAIVGNPPYARLGPREDLAGLAAHFTAMAHRANSSNETFPLFVEQMIRLSSTPPAVGTMVVPLSLACNIGPQFSALRTLIEQTPGEWKFAFFDREPHALFGEDVKTRNSILFWKRSIGDSYTRIRSGPLRKWRAEDRAAMFSSIRFTPLSSSIRNGIPKLEGAPQARAFDFLAKRSNRFGHVYTTMRRVPLAQTIHARQDTVFVAGTAYNFLNAFLSPSPRFLPADIALSEHQLHAVDLPSAEHAMAAFAILSSRLAYWWWRATQDGFHVTARFLSELPFGSDLLTDPVRGDLAACGRTLWSLVSEHPIVSVNRGKASLAFSPNKCDHERTQIDDLLAAGVGLDVTLVRHVRLFVTETIAAETPFHQTALEPN